VPALEAGLPRAEALGAVKRAFAKANIDGPTLDARLLTLAALRVDQSELLRRPEKRIGEKAAARLAEFATRRLAGEPIARILGVREFWGLEFALSAGTLVPRPETETLVEAVLRYCQARGDHSGSWNILDLGTGSGCIAIALLTELPNALVVGVDRSPDALATAHENARRHRVADRACWVASDWVGAIATTFDIVVSNPPYIAAVDMAALCTEVRDHDPPLALDGGRDGLDAYRAIIAELGRLTNEGGQIFLEVGAGQSEAVRALFRQTGFRAHSPIRDLAGTARVVTATERP
jgi:release factor glutamine methyltransferase